MQAVNPCRDAALDLERRGLPLTICRQKAPLGFGWTPDFAGTEWPFKRWTAEEIETVYDACPASNVGAQLGKVSGMFDIECDGEQAAADLEKLFEGCEMPPTPTFSSVRGKHRLFARDDRLKAMGKAVVKVGAVEVRIGVGAACHSCLPPSRNTDGTERKWDAGLSIDDCKPAPLPEVVIARILASKKADAPAPRPAIHYGTVDRARVITRARAYIARIEGAVTGQRGHDATFHVACILILGFGLSQDEAWPLFAEWNVKCRPEWTERELRRKLSEANKQTGERGTMLDDEPQFTNGSTAAANGHRHDGETAVDSINAELAGESFEENACHAGDNLPTIALPGGATTITSAATNLGRLLASTGRFFVRGGGGVRLERDKSDGLSLKPLRPAGFASDLEGVARLVRVQQTKGGEQLVPANCSESAAKLILESAALRDALPPITILTPCPVLTEQHGRLITVVGYHRESGILAQGEQPDLVTVQDAVALLSELLDEFRFAHAGDRARAVAATITPALVFGGLLGGRAPIDLGEADQSQTGKGFRNKITAAIYGTKIGVVTQRTAGGVGSTQEAIDAKLVAGACVLSLDNFRGKLDLPFLESMATEDTYSARVPYGSPVDIDPRRVVVMFTSNKAELTIDLANRSSCVRILKQLDGHQFRQYPAGDLLDHVIANRARYLGAVFAVVREWFDRGKPQLSIAKHDFRRWARTLGWITENILGAGDLLANHREAQARMASPALNWLRDVCLALQRAGRLGYWLRANQILQLVVEHGIETPGIDLAADLEDETEFLKSSRKVGYKLSRLFTAETVRIDQFTVERSRTTDDSYRQTTEYCVSFETPQDPEPHPEGKPETPQDPQGGPALFAN